MQSKPAVLEKIGQSKEFNDYWENLQKKVGRVLEEAHNRHGTMNDWIDACNALQTETEKIKGFGWSVRHGHVTE